MIIAIISLPWIMWNLGKNIDFYWYWNIAAHLGWISIAKLFSLRFFFRKQGVKGILDISNNDNQSDSNNKKQYRKLCSYILQDDNLFPWFTVHESMTIAANLKISKECMNMEEKQILIDNILDTLHLSFAKETRCANLSGGQKKRLSIALELIDNPPILFLDEPTTLVFK